jgi:hypothetical protein
MAAQFSEAPAGNPPFLYESNEAPQREAEGLRPRPGPWKDHRLVVPRNAALSPRPARHPEITDPLIFLKK